MPRFARKGKAKFAAPGPTGWPGSLVTPSIAGIVVTPQTALSFTAYYAGIRVIAEDVSSLPVAVFRRKPRGGQRLVKDHPISWAFRRSPAGDSRLMSSMQWREAWISHALGWGNGYAEIDWSGGGEFKGLNLLNPANVTVRYDASDRVYYEVSNAGRAMAIYGGSLAVSNAQAKVEPRNMLHLACVGFNGLVGYSPVGLARECIGLGKAAEQFGASLFGNGAIPKGIVKYPGELSPEARANIRDSFNAIHRGSASGNKVAILEEGMEWQDTQIDPEDAQFLATRQFQVIEIARILRLPPHKLGDYSQSHLASVEAANLDYLMTCLRPWCVRIEECMDLKLLTDEEIQQGYYVRHDIRAMLRANVKDMGDYYQKMFQFGMSPDEIRELEGMNPIGKESGGQKRFRPANMVELAPDEDEEEDENGLEDEPEGAEPGEVPEDERQEAEGETDPDVSPDEAVGFAGPPNRLFNHRRNGEFSASRGLE
jgi:HK97 family phage portal protein